MTLEALERTSLSSTELRGYHDHLRGEESENRVAQVLAELPTVVAIRRTQLNSPEDAEGVDMFVHLKQTGVLPPDFFVKVQVKSSKRTRRDFRESISRRHGVPGNQRNQWLTANGFVVLIGQSNESEIASEFYGQLDRIIELQKKHSEP